MKNIKREIKKTEKYKLENFSKLFLQIGLVVTLLIILVVFENSTEIYSPNDTKDDSIASYEEFDLVDFVLAVEPEPNKPEPQTKSAPKFDLTDIVPVDTDPIDPIDPVDVPTQKPTQTESSNPFGNTPAKPQLPIKPDVATWSKIEKAPMFPGCENHKTEKARRKCLQEKISNHISKHFNSDLANELSLDSGKNRIMVQFKIDQNGNIIDIIAAAPHQKLKKEAIRIIEKLPKMSPGKQRDKAVIVKYALPINFMVE